MGEHFDLFLQQLSIGPIHQSCRKALACLLVFRLPWLQETDDFEIAV